MSTSEQLAELEQLDQRRKQLEEELAAIHGRARGDAELRRLEQQQAALEQRLLQVASTTRQLELEVATLQGRRKDHERAIYDGSVRHVADLQRRQHELEMLKAKISQQEDAELARLEEQEQVQAELIDARGRVEERRRGVDQQRDRDRQRQPQVEVELQQTAEARATNAAALPAAAVQLYQRTAARRHPAVVQARQGTCSGCRLPLPARLLQELRQGKLVTCENCERILVL